MSASNQRFIGPQSGAQTMFMSTEADIAIYAGPRGTGKSYAGLLSILQGCHLPGYGAVVLRRLAPELTGPGSVWDQSQELFSKAGGKSRSAPRLEWVFPQSGASVIFSHLQHESDVKSHQGKQYAQILFEEVTQFTEAQFWGMYASARTTSGVKPFVRCTTNPDPDSFIRLLIDWWIDKAGFLIPERSGVLRWLVRDKTGHIVWFDDRESAVQSYPLSSPISFTVIRATRADNKILLDLDPEYDSRLEALPPTKRAQWLEGNWNVRDQGEMFSREWFNIIQSVPGKVIARVRAWDFAYTAPHPGNPDPDYTVGALVSLTNDGRYTVEDIVTTRASGGVVKNFVQSIAYLDGPEVQVVLPHDPAGGAYVVEDMKKALSQYVVKSVPVKSSKESYAQVWSTKAETGHFQLLEGQWIDSFLKEVESFPKGSHDDQIDAVSLAVVALPKGPPGTAFVPGSFGSYHQPEANTGSTTTPLWDPSKPRAAKTQYTTSIVTRIKPRKLCW